MELILTIKNNMVILDFFYYKLYRAILHLRKDGAELSAFLYLSSYLAAIILSIMALVKPCINSSFQEYFDLHNLAVWMTVWIVPGILLSFRYYRRVTIKKIELRFNAMAKQMQKTINIIIISAMVIIPILVFVILRNSKF